jgi:two-component system phosphate regulon sensor histidine kinase PhoR
MARPRIRPIRLLSTTLTRALPGVGVLCVLWILGVLAPLWVVGGIIACIVIAAWHAVPVARDLAALSAYADDLAQHGGEAAPAKLSDWPPASELAAAMRRIDQAAQRRRRREGNAFDYLPQPLLLIGPDRRIVAANDPARAMIGMNAVGGDLATAFREPAILEATDAVRAGGTARSVDFTVTGATDRCFAAGIVPFEDPTAEGATVLIALYDLTAHRRTERLRSDFIANASHELRTPLASLIGFIETLRGPARDDADARERFLAIMDETAQRMSRLVQNLLSLSRIEMEEHTLPDTPVDMTRLCRTVADSLQITADRKNIKIAVEADADVPSATGDADQLTQLLQNLIDNAIKYGRKNSQVTVALRRCAPAPAALNLESGRPAVAITVSDQGEGIAPEHIPRLTERFYRADPSRARDVGGTGLGLAIAKHIVSRHRGRLEIASEIGKGSIFTVILPGQM